METPESRSPADTTPAAVADRTKPPDLAGPTAASTATGATELQELRKEVRELREKVIRFEATAAAISIVAAAVGLWGYNTMTQVEQKVQTTISEKTDRLTQAAFGVTYASAHPRLALRPLLDTVQNLDSLGDPSMQEGILITTMYVLDELDDWETSRPFLDIVKRLPYHRFKLPLTFNNIGMTELNVALLEKDSAKRDTILDQARNSLERGILKNKGQRELTEQETTENDKYLTMNYWRYYVAKKDWRGAEQMIDRLKQIPDITVGPYEEIRKWRQIRELDSEQQKIVADMWGKLRDKWQRSSASTSEPTTQ